MNVSPNQMNHRRELLEWLEAGGQTYDELLERYRRALPARDVDTEEAFAVLIGSLVGEGLLERELVSDGDPGARAIQRVWLSEKGKSLAGAGPTAR